MEQDILRIQILRSLPEGDHFHEDAELFFVLEGALDIRMGDQRSLLREEDVFIANLQKSYVAQASPDALFAKITLPFQLISRSFQSSHVLFWCDSSRQENTQFQELRQVLKKLLERYLALHGKLEDFGYQALCYQLLDLLASHFCSSMVAGSEGKERFGERMEQINSYIYANYNQPLSSKELAEKLYLSQGYLSRFFRKAYGLSFAEYLTNVRLYHAVDDLLYSDRPVTRIAFDNGFPNVTAFTKAFRERYGGTPSAFRRQHAPSSAQRASDQEAERRLEEVLRRDPSLRDQPAAPGAQAIRCPVDRWEPCSNPWCDTINVGAAKDLLDSRVREHVAQLAGVLKLRHVRFWNMFSREMLLDGGGEGVYNFSRVDAVLDFLLEIGVKPHIELGAKPRRLYRAVGNALVEEPRPEEALPGQEWLALFRQVINHWKIRYTPAELESWRLELWFEEGQWGMSGSAARYFARFQQVYQVAKEAFPGFEVGGCGLRLGFDMEDDAALGFLQAWQEQPAQPDFFSILYYPYDRGEMNQDSYSRRSTDNDGLLHRVNGARRLMARAGMEGKKLYVTEWNVTISDRNFINDSCFKGAYMVKNALDVLGKADLVSYFFATDLVSEYGDSRGLLHGGSGVISKDGIIKPAGFGLMLLSWLYGNVAAKGSHYCVTTDGQGSYSILCHNQKPLNYRYYLSREDEIQKEEIGKYFEDREPLPLSLELEGVPQGTYQVKSYEVSEKTGSVLHLWGRMGFEQELSRDDTQYLNRICVAGLRIGNVEARDGVLPLSFTLKPNEIRLLRVRRMG